MLCHPSELFGSERVTPSSLYQQITQSLELCLDALGILGLGAIWQESSQAPIQALGITHNTKRNPIELSSQQQLHLRFPLDSTLYDQLPLQKYREHLSQASPAIVGPTNIKLPIPDCITSFLSSSLSSPTQHHTCKVKQEIPCQTSILGFLSTTPDCVHWIILWHQESLSPLQKFAAHQQANIFQQHLLRSHEKLTQNCQDQTHQASLQRIHHQLKTPLEIIQIHIDLISQYECSQNQEAGAELSPIAVSLGKIQSTLDNINHGLKRLTDYRSNQESYTYDNIGALFHRMIKGLQPLIAEKQLSIQQEHAFCTICIDSWKITQAFQNILHNSILFSPYAGQINCQSQCFKNEVLIQISDQGPGITEKEKEEIFLPFYSNRPGGTGMGLTIAKQIILEHQGRIWAETLVDGGVQFSIVLPLLNLDDVKATT